MGFCFFNVNLFFKKHNLGILKHKGKLMEKEENDRPSRYYFDSELQPYKISSLEIAEDSFLSSEHEAELAARRLRKNIRKAYSGALFMKIGIEDLRP